MNDQKEKLILALDVSSAQEAIQLVTRFAPYIEIFKVGFELFTAAGPDVVKQIQQRGKKVFLDLKFHDIPNTVAHAGVVAAKLGVFMFNMHVSGGVAMMKACRDGVARLCLKENLQRPKLLGVTILTSLDNATLKDELGFLMSLPFQVKHFANLALQAGLDGVVASPQEIIPIREKCGDRFLIVTPGIRPSWRQADDQKRTLSPLQALRHGADFIVMGRSILQEQDPIYSIQRTLEEMARA
jgi:orotidine-5'-phosphate decarboxylase